MNTTAVVVTPEEFWELVRIRSEAIREFLLWALDVESSADSMYLANRPDITDARKALSNYELKWWGLVVFTCFGSVTSAKLLADSMQQPVSVKKAESILAETEFVKPKVGHHRKQATLRGAKRALLAACRNSPVFHDVLLEDRSFHERYQCLRDAKLEQWGRTTCFDLLIRGGAIPVGPCEYLPEYAYLGGSSGPSRGFEMIWGMAVNDRTTPWCEEIVQLWHQNWKEVAAIVQVPWSIMPYNPGDLENALCVYQECSK